MEIIWRGSPNYDKNRKPIDRIVIHWFGVGTLASADARFQKASEQSSAHYGVSGNTVYQWVREEHVAYHADNYAMNQRSIGIEHDAGIDPKHDLSEESYRTSARLIAEIAKRHGIPLDRQHIIGHKEIKATQCPGTINIDKLIQLAKGGDDEVITDKTKIPANLLSGEHFKTDNDMEVSVVKSKLNDLTRDLTNCESRPPQIVKEEVIKEVEVVKEVPVYKEQFNNPVSRALLKLAKFFEE